MSASPHTEPLRERSLRHGWRAFISMLLLSGCESPPMEVQPLRVDPPALTAVWSTSQELNLAKHVTCRLSNPGKSAVEVTGITATCHCTLPEGFQRTVLRPGDSLEVTLKVTAARLGNKTSVIRVATIPEEAATEFAVMAQGPKLPLPYIMDTSAELELVASREGETGTAKFRLQVAEDPDAAPSVTTFGLDSPILKGRVIGMYEQSSKGADHVVRVYDCEVAGTITSGIIRRPVVLTINGDEDHRIIIRPKIIPRFRVLPAKLSRKLHGTHDGRSIGPIRVVRTSASEQGDDPTIELGGQTSVKLLPQPRNPSAPSVLGTFLIEPTSTLEVEFPLKVEFFVVENGVRHQLEVTIVE